MPGRDVDSGVRCAARRTPAWGWGRRRRHAHILAAHAHVAVLCGLAGAVLLRPARAPRGWNSFDSVGTANES